MSAEHEVRGASEQFYAALNRTLNGDAGPMAEIWSHGATVTTMHPIGGREVGWDNVRESFAQFALLAEDGQVKLDDQVIQINGDMAYELGIEKGHVKLGGQMVSIEHRATNIYRRDAGGWKLVHHHTDVSPATVDRLRSLQTGK